MPFNSCIIFYHQNFRTFARRFRESTSWCNRLIAKRACNPPIVEHIKYKLKASYIEYPWEYTII
jgi:hypothetical protein